MAARPSAQKALTRYREKRNFDITSEPSGAEPVKANGNVKARGDGFFVVQKHEATRLHYDFRLALDGVLKSWAVAKGPSLNPHDKRLAVEVEDHPVAYGDFEGTIPKGQYGGGTVMLWDHGAWAPIGDAAAGLEKGELKFELHGERLKGKWVLVRMKPRPKERHNNWLLIKERDDAVREGETPLTDAALTSVTTGRTMDEIAGEHDRVWHSDQPADEQPDAAPQPAPPPLRGRSARSAGRGDRAASGHDGDSETAAPVPPTRPRKAVADLPLKGGGAALRGKSPLPDFIPPQLATRVAAPPSAKGWLHEIKFDGYRVLARIDSGTVTVRTRRGHDWTNRFGQVASALSKLPVKQALIDGEIVVMTDSGVTDFGKLQETLAGESRYALSLQAFDLLHLDGDDLTGKPLIERKAQLQPMIAALGKQSTILYSDHIENLGDKVFAQACQLALEGVVSKRADAVYRSGRSDSWVKSKCIERQEFVIAGYSKSSVAGKGLGSLLLGYYRGKTLTYAGRVGTGFNEASVTAIRKALDRIERATPPFKTRPPGAGRDVTWVEPELVCEVEFLTWTGDGLLRHASFKGLREDKPAREVTIERPQSASGAKGGKTAMAETTVAKPSSAGEKALAKIVLTHPERVLDPDSGLTKRGLAEYLALVADRMLPHITDRPISFVRCPGGTAKACFYQKHIETQLPPGIGSVTIKEKEGTGDYLTIDTAEGLIGLAQMGVLEVHPWGSRADDVEKPDRLIFDFDPAPDVQFTWVVEAALAMRERLEKLGLESFLKTTGGKGLHVVAPIKREHEWPLIKEFARAVATATAAESDRFVTVMTKAKRTGKIFIDFFRNDRGATAVAPYSTRARPGAPVATPLDWKEATPSLSPSHFTVETMPRRLAQLPDDPWAPMLTAKQSIGKAALKAMKVG
jgi:bifunctional non-homologous end joining protein LigD